MKHYYIHKNKVVCFNKELPNNLVTEKLNETSNYYLKLSNSQKKFYEKNLTATALDIFYKTLGYTIPNETPEKLNNSLLDKYCLIKCIDFNGELLTCEEAKKLIDIYEEVKNYELFNLLKYLYNTEVNKLVE